MIKKIVILFTTTILLFLAPVLFATEITYVDPDGKTVTWDGKMRFNPHYVKKYKEKTGREPHICLNTYKVYNPDYKNTGGPYQYVFMTRFLAPGLDIDFTKGIVNGNYVECTDEALKIHCLTKYKYYPISVTIYQPNKGRGVPEVNKLYGITYDEDGWVLSWTRRERKDPEVRRLLEQRRR